jgi:prolipoprotein diacylglyceryltransferase
MDNLLRKAITLRHGCCSAVRFEIIVYEWEHFARHPIEIPAYWLGGMASHGVMLGGVIAVAVFSRWKKVPFARIADELALPAARSTIRFISGRKLL